MVVALLALFVAMGGVGYAALKLPKNSVGTKQIKKNAVTSIKVKNHSLTGIDVNAGTLGTVPTATNAVHALSADNATHAGLAPAEGWHEVDAPGEPGFQNGWKNTGPATDVTAAFYKDPYGVVHLKGLVYNGPNDAPIFTLPEGYRPSKFVIQLVWRGSGSGKLGLLPDGSVQFQDGAAAASLDGVTFRAGE
jgi:hypothetical protein